MMRWFSPVVWGPDRARRLAVRYVFWGSEGTRMSSLGPFRTDASHDSGDRLKSL